MQKRPFLRRVVRLILFMSILIVGLVAFAYAGLYWLAYRGMPVLDGEVRLAGVVKGATITRDTWGVPHIEAESEADAYFALGYSMAQDRLFQMELLRRLAEGELSELVGSAALDVDRAMRTLRLKPKAAENAARMREKYPEVTVSTDAFLAGVNEYAMNGPMPFEFVLLGIPRRTYTLTDSLCIAGILPITFSYGPRQDAMFSIVQQKFPETDMNLLFPGYSQGIPSTVMETPAEAEAILRERGLWPPRTSGAASTPTAALQPFVDQWQVINDLLGSHLGSNSWVLAPSRTPSGGALLANDPHIGFTNPAIWYEAHVKYDGFENYGYYLPMIPIALIGHNRNHGWGLTMFANDDVDLFVEKLDPGNPNRVMHKGSWTDLVVEQETIKVRFSDDVIHEVRVTPHGPIITPLLAKYEDYQGDPVSLYWVWQHVEYTDIAGFYRMARAADYDAFADAVKLVTSPGVNVSYADRAGNIAWWAAGMVPVRAPHVNNKGLLDGSSGADELLGFLPFEQNPHLKNPASGYVATANNKSSVRAFGPIDDLEGYWQPWDRAERIEEKIESQATWSVDETKRLQVDGVGVAAPEIIKAISEALAGVDATLTPRERELLALLQSWGGLHSVDAIEPTVYTYLCDAILARTVSDELGANNFKVYSTLGDAWNFLRYVVHQDESPFWDDRTTTDRVETRADIFALAMHEAVARIEGAHGTNQSNWVWGKDHTVTYKHPFGFIPYIGGMFNVGPLAAPGGAQTINNLLYPHGVFKHDVIAGPSTRRVIDFSDPEHSFSILPTGNSGHWRSPNYGDQAEMYMRGEYREVALTSDQIAADSAHVLKLLPKQ